MSAQAPQASPPQPGASPAASPAYGPGPSHAVTRAGTAPQNSATFRGTFRKADGCPYLVSSGGTHYYLPGYTIGGNGALYKKGGGFIAYPGWKIQANGTKQYKPLGNRTTLCTSWGDTHRIKARSIYALQH
ncbi:hypothetical protein [Streptomyces sp. NPDC057582]|uniref:hypothetical protein n=1 Tax=Streptomyces sp. NPDC057582 TaxID=3346174 RepID=UPI00369A8A7B